MTKILINGIVQGIGFRPFIYKLAKKHFLKGYVKNSSSGIEIVINGNLIRTAFFIHQIKKKHPVSAYIENIEVTKINEKQIFKKFTIDESTLDSGYTFVSPDLSLCKKCTAELNSKSNRRYHHPFINCTDCGPRYSIIRSLPYDRKNSAMHSFKMCPECSSEYKEPENRRFHAQPNSCFECGPKLILKDREFNILSGDPIQQTIRLLQDGKIVAIKGIGGFHIACDATNEAAVMELRRRKNRGAKPFAVMGKLSELKKAVKMNGTHIRLLKSYPAPVLILPKKKKGIVCSEVAPDNRTLGVFIPYTPIQHLLFNQDIKYLVMTSANLTEEPIARDEEEIKGICDYYLTHDRPIYNRSDDSVILPNSYQNLMIRRSKGFVPYPIKLPFNTVPALGVGGELKISFSLSKEDSLFLSPYLGDGGNKKSYDYFLEVLDLYRNWFKINPEIIASDMHPDYFTTELAKSTHLPHYFIQHHHAHIASVMAEYRLNEPVLGVAYDGTGYGTDGTIWGGEILLTEYSRFKRLFHLEPMPLVGGDASIKNPYRIALAYLSSIGENVNLIQSATETEINLINKQLEGNHFIKTSSMGRLFDCVSSMLGLCDQVTFEGEAAVILEQAAVRDDLDFTYEYDFDGEKIVIQNILKGISKDIQHNFNKSVISFTFHQTIIKLTLEALIKAKKLTGIKKVVLSGGVMQNKILLEGLIRELKRHHFILYVPRLLPVNDSGISVGQVVIANVLGNSR